MGLEATLTESGRGSESWHGRLGVSGGSWPCPDIVGLECFLSVGAYLGEDILDEHGANGFSVGLGWRCCTVYGTLTDADGVRRIGMVDLSDPTAASPVTLQKRGRLDAEGVSSPVVYQVEDSGGSMQVKQTDFERSGWLAPRMD